MIWGSPGPAHQMTAFTRSELTGPRTEPYTLNPVSNASGDRQLYFVGTTWSGLAPFKD